MHSDYSHQRQDPIANAIVSQYSWYTLVALHSTGNGDCLFNSFSLCLAGDESRAIELRYRCCIEMTTNRARMLRHRLYRALEPVSPDFDTDCLKCAQKGQYASMWNILALANLLKVKVTVVYPTVNGSETYIFKNLNQKIKPPFVDPEKPTITIMWTSTRPPPKNGLARQTGTGWKPDHFVPLVRTNRPVETAELPEITCDFKDISNTTANPLTIKDNYQQNSVSLARSAKPRRRKITNSVASVKKGSRLTSPGVQHSDCMQKDNRKVEDSKAFENVVKKGSPCASPGDQHSDCSLKDNQTEEDSEAVENVVRKGSSCASPGVQHPECKLNTQQADHELHLFNHDEDRVQNEEGDGADTSLMETDVISQQMLSTIEGELTSRDSAVEKMLAY